MSTLATRLAEIREGAIERIPVEIRRTMKEATEELKASGLEEGVVGPGTEAPLFGRPDPEGTTVRLESLLRRGPVILSFFRGRW